jgi:hypothetical protein
MGLSEDCVGEAGSPTRLLALSRVKSSRKCNFLMGSAEEQVNELVKRLSESGVV